MFPCRDNFSPSRHCFHGKLWNYPFINILKVGKMSQLEENILNIQRLVDFVHF